MKEFLDDLYEIINNINDDMELDLGEGENGYATYKESYFAINEYTRVVIESKIKKWKRKLGEEQPKK